MNGEVKPSGSGRRAPWLPLTFPTFPVFPSRILSVARSTIPGNIQAREHPAKRRASDTSSLWSLLPIFLCRGVDHRLRPPAGGGHCPRALKDDQIPVTPSLSGAVNRLCPNEKVRAAGQA